MTGTVLMDILKFVTNVARYKDNETGRKEAYHDTEKFRQKQFHKTLQRSDCYSRNRVYVSVLISISV